MKELIKHITALALSFLLLLSTLSIQVDMHFCGKHLVAIGIGHKAATCGMEQTCSGTGGQCIMAAMHSCKDIQIVLKGQDNLQKTVNSGYQAPSFQVAVVHPAWPDDAQQPFILFLTKQHYRDYAPPPLIRKVHLLHETFLI